MGGGVGLGWGQDGFERRIEVCYFFLGGSGRGVWSGVGLGDQGICEQRSEVFAKINKKMGVSGRGGGGSGGGGGLRVDVNKELKFL